MSHATHHPEDKGAALTGLVLGAVIIGAILYSIVVMTNKHYEGEKPAATAEAPAK
jgi:hypothetical protein